MDIAQAKDRWATREEQNNIRRVRVQAGRPARPPQALSPIAGNRPAGDEREGEREDKP